MSESESNSVSRAKTWLDLVLAFIAGVVVACLTIWYSSPYLQAYHAIEESRMASSALTSQGQSMSPQMREWLKGRIYWNAAVWIPKGMVPEVNVDLGPIDENALGGLGVAKDGSTPDAVYRAAMKRYSINK